MEILFFRRLLPRFDITISRSERVAMHYIWTYCERPWSVMLLVACDCDGCCVWAATAAKPAANGFEVSALCPALVTTGDAETTGTEGMAEIAAVAPWVEFSVAPWFSGLVADAVRFAWAMFACATAFAKAVLLDWSCDAAKAATALKGYPLLPALWAAKAALARLAIAARLASWLTETATVPIKAWTLLMPDRPKGVEKYQ